MPTVNVSNELYQLIQQSALNAGFANVDDYVAEVLSCGFPNDTENFDHLFTPERMAQIAQSEREMDAGHFYTMEQADAELAKRKENWLRENPQSK